MTLHNFEGCTVAIERVSLQDVSDGYRITLRKKSVGKNHNTTQALEVKY